MRIIADLHIHSRYSRATSREMNLDSLSLWAGLKGINLLGTGDFTHPAHLASIEEKLEPDGRGLFALRTGGGKNPVRFMLTAEVSNIYSQGGKTRRVHNLIFAPSIEAVKKMNSAFAKLGNINSDGRPIFGFSSQDLIKIVLDSSPDAMLVPAHAWTPWFSIFGSKSGFDSIEECFGDYAKHIHAIETGLSSDPQMNWGLSGLDGITLISNSDAHSPSKLGREANVFDCNLDYHEITKIIKEKDIEKFLFTIEFFPEEGKYHYDGHRECGVRLSPDETSRAGRICSVCGKEVTVGVMSRVLELADRPLGFIPENAIPARHIIPLDEILAQSLDCGVNSVKVKRSYKRLVAESPEFDILLNMPQCEIDRLSGAKVAEAIARMRNGDVNITPGFDGEFGKIEIFRGNEVAAPGSAPQIRLF